MVRYETSPPRATLTIDDPERHNPLSTDTMGELASAVRKAAADDAVRVIVVTGAGERSFSAGGDLSGSFVDEPLGRHGERGALADLFRSLYRAGKPTVARVNGHALGGGFGVAAACDIVVAAEEATLGMPEVDVGLWPMMVIAVAVRATSRKAALEAMMTGRRLGAEEAMGLGLVSRVVPATELDATVDELVENLAAKSPVALRLGRDAFYAAADMGFDAALDYLQNGLTAVALSDDAAEGIDAFLSKRPPQWKGS